MRAFDDDGGVGDLREKLKKKRAAGVEVTRPWAVMRRWQPLPRSYITMYN